MGIPASQSGETDMPILKFTDANGAVFVAYSNYVFTPNVLDVSSVSSSSGV